MAPSFDCVSNVLENGSHFESWDNQGDTQQTHLSLSFFAAEDDESLSVLLQKEPEFMPKQGYVERFRNRTLDLNARREAVNWILKVHCFYNFGSLTGYLAVNYLDRFLSIFKLPQGTCKAWMLQLVSVACLSLAVKMADIHVPLLQDLQGEDAKFIFDAHTIQRMELLVLSTLQWRMHSVTPFSFVDYFVSKAIERNNVTPVHLIERAVELILNTVKVADMAEYKPSAIAAAAVLCAAEEVVPLEAAHYKRVLSSCSNVDKERMFGCYNLIQEIMIENSFTRSKKNQISGGSLSAAKTPTGVLDAGACFSSWDSDKTSATRTSSISVEPYAKRRKLNEFCSSVFVSEVQPC
ncbi:hypothetical protein SUGI_0656620 [Cryptomeria japonica]|uniref:cyclin-D3-1 n=1 Tax=Cryptomeria japonica TaxID=3369 RepID=UPI002414C9ED|nr:cyclin-D3-1 [Cryptomeria japonica]GLJ32639.1 hypothetical protein SUGI_0656620 [Cryptomeria japonica]